ncbi:MAG: hypothetical protein ACP5OG_01390 [Candidatus Nanoarchaeia archaeon]
MDFEEKKGFIPGWIKGAVAGYLIYAGISGGIHFINNAFNYDKNLQSTKQVQSITAENKQGNRNFAVLVSGVARSDSKSKGLNKDLERAYNILKDRGYGEEDIIILSNYIPKSRSLEGTITARPNSENLKNVLNYVSNNAGKDGSITFYFDGDGGRKKQGSTLILGNDKFNSKDFSVALRGNKSDKIFIFNQCYSGGFLDDLKDLEGNMAFMSSTSKGKAGINSGFQEYFWNDVQNGKRVDEAYKDAIEKSKSNWSHKFGRFIGADNDYVIVNKGNIDLPKKDKNSENFNLVNLEKRVLKNIFVAAITGVIIYLLGKGNITGRVIGTSKSTDFLFLTFFLLFFALFGYKIIKKIKKGEKI